MNNKHKKKNHNNDCPYILSSTKPWKFNLECSSNVICFVIWGYVYYHVYICLYILFSFTCNNNSEFISQQNWTFAYIPCYLCIWDLSFERVFWNYLQSYTFQLKNRVISIYVTWTKQKVCFEWHKCNLKEKLFFSLSRLSNNDQQFIKS